MTCGGRSWRAFVAGRRALVPPVVVPPVVVPPVVPPVVPVET